MADQTAAPIAATLFAYQVGFGDCFLLRFTYPGDNHKHVLIDFGTTGLTVDSPKEQMLLIANDIAKKCDGKLDVVVATHRHADHISGFATNDEGTASGDVIRKLRPEVVVQPWTEAPDAPKDWEGPEGEDKQMSFAMRRQSLAAMDGIARLARDTVDQGLLRVPKAVADQLHFIGEDNIANKSAVKNLATMGEPSYVFHGCDPGLAKVLPGIGVTVLGPPTLRQTETITTQKSKDKDEFWHLAPLQFAHAVGAAPVVDDDEDGDDEQAGVAQPTKDRPTKRKSELFPDAKVRLATKLPAESLGRRTGRSGQRRHDARHRPRARQANEQHQRDPAVRSGIEEAAVPGRRPARELALCAEQQACRPTRRGRSLQGRPPRQPQRDPQVDVEPLQEAQQD